MREEGKLDFTGIEHLDLDCDDSLGPELMRQLHDLRSAFIRKRIDEEKKATFSFPALVKTTSETERQDVLNFFRPISDRTKTGGLPTPSRPIKNTLQTPPSTENDPEGVDVARSNNEEKTDDTNENSQPVEVEGKTIEESCDVELKQIDQDSKLATERFDEDDHLLDHSDEGGAWASCFRSTESDRDNQPALTEGNEIQGNAVPLKLPPSRTSWIIPVPASPTSAVDILYEQDFGDSSWPSILEGEFDELDEPEGPITLGQSSLLKSHF